MKVNCTSKVTVYLPFLLSVILSQLQADEMNSVHLEGLLGFEGANCNFDSIREREELYISCQKF